MGCSPPVSVESFVRDCEEFFEQLDTDELRTIAMLRIEGYSVDEIAGRIGCAKRSVERRLNLIRQIWTSAFEDLR
jgi:DNA-directed RNA polymerase specialized sigma24 family protein